MVNLHESYEQQNKEQAVSEEDVFTNERYKQFCKMFPHKSKRILDIGCNTGRGGLVLKELDNDFQIYGLDCVQDRLDRLPSAYSRRIYGLSTDIPVEDKSFDVVVAGEFLEHLYPSDVDKTLCEMQRVLRIGGRLLLTTPNPYYLRNRLRHGTVYGVSHLTQHFPESIAFRMKMHGFSNIRTLGSGRVSRYIGCHFPLLSVYGSYMIYGDKF